MEKAATYVSDEAVAVSKSPERSSPFEPPLVRTVTSTEIQAEIGPAQMCSPSPCPLSP